MRPSSHFLPASTPVLPRGNLGALQRQLHTAHQLATQGQWKAWRCSHRAEDNATLWRRRSEGAGQSQASSSLPPEPQRGGDKQILRPRKKNANCVQL